jgi:3',5'-cyclic-AMP phosphodiesterase
VRKPFLLVQLSDPHIGAEWGGDDSEPKLAAAVASVRALAPSPDAVLISGDLADNASNAEYEQVRELLAPLDAPLYVLPGNHDDRSALRRHFDVPGADDQPVQYAADLGTLRLVVLDSTRPGEIPGELDADSLAWLDATLAAADTPTLVALHHPPLATGIPAYDEMGLSATSRVALGTVIAAYPQVRRVVAGHMHRAITADLVGRSVLAVPSTYVQARLEFDAEEVQLSAEPCGFAVHTVLDGEVVSHVLAVQ